MKPRISLIALAVDDLERALVFYRDGLGLPTDGIVDGADPIRLIVAPTPLPQHVGFMQLIKT